VIEENFAGQHLESAIISFSLGYWDDAIESFWRAIKTGGLNDAGRALAYWHIAQCYNNLGNKDGVIEALFNFASVAQDIIDIQEVHKFNVTQDDDFITNFELVGKLLWARSIVNFEWSSRSDVYGKSRENPIIVRNIEELETFIGVVKDSCSGKCDFQRIPLHEDSMPVEPRTEIITISDRGINKKFIVVVVEK
jgi:tetratricopeptide (TPR) repeat protein